MPQPGVLLIHGLGGTHHDLGALHKRLHAAGFATHALTLPGHGSRPEDLTRTRTEDWLDAVHRKYREAAARHEVLHVMGMCMGALLALELAKRERHARGSLVMLAPPLYLDGWSVPWYGWLRHAVYRVPALAARMRVAERPPYGIKNEQLREIVKAKFRRGDGFHYPWVPLACIREVDRLRAMALKDLDGIACRTLVVHARLDELTSLRSAHRLVERIGAGPRAGQARMVVLEDSYHMVCIDNDREIVARSVVEFLDAEGICIGPDDPRMSADGIAELLHAVRADLARGDLAALYARGTTDFAWFQPGLNRMSGVFRGRLGLVRLQRQLGQHARFAIQGEPAINAGMAVWPATLRSGALASAGMLSVCFRRGRLLEARWLPHDPVAEDQHFGGQPTAENPKPRRRIGGLQST